MLKICYCEIREKPSIYKNMGGTQHLRQIDLLVQKFYYEIQEKPSIYNNMEGTQHLRQIV